MPTLFVRCRRCRTAFPTRLALGDADRSSLVVSGLSQRCPGCGTEDLYFTKDVFVPPATTSADPRPPTRAARGRSAGISPLRDVGARVWSWFGLS